MSRLSLISLNDCKWKWNSKEIKTYEKQWKRRLISKLIMDVIHRWFWCVSNSQLRKLWWVSYSITTQIDKGPNVVWLKFLIIHSSQLTNKIQIKIHSFFYQMCHHTWNVHQSGTHFMCDHWRDFLNFSSTNDVWSKFKYS